MVERQATSDVNGTVIEGVVDDDEETETVGGAGPFGKYSTENAPIAVNCHQEAARRVPDAATADPIPRLVLQKATECRAL